MVWYEVDVGKKTNRSNSTQPSVLSSKFGESRQSRSDSVPSASSSPNEFRATFWWSRPWILCAVLAVGTLAAYWPATQAEFLPFDDQEYIFRNPQVFDGFSRDSIVWAFTKVHISNWHPLTWLSHMLDSEMFGVQPGGHHAMSILWHVANVMLLFIVLTKLTDKALPSFAVAALFAVHPTHVEAVAWVAQRKTLISTFFILLSIWTYFNYVRHKSWRWYAASLLLFALSLLSKQTFVTMPGLLVLLDFWPIRRGLDNAGAQHSSLIKMIQDALRFLPDKLPFAALGVAAALVTVLAQTDAIQSLESLPVPLRLSNVCVAYVRYLAGIFWPAKLSIYYTFHAEDLTTVRIAGAVLLILILSGGALWLRNRLPQLVTGWFWFLVSMLPVIGIIHVGSQSMADRYLYNASLGIFLAVVWMVADWLAKIERHRPLWIRSTMCVAMAGIMALAVLTYQRTRQWRTVEGTFGEAIQHDPTNWLAHCLLAEWAIEKREFEKAIPHAQQALDELELPRFYVMYSVASRELDDRPGAIEKLQRALELEPDDALASSLLAVNFLELERNDEAEAMRILAEEKIQLPANQAHPRIPALALRNCGNVLLQFNRPAEAMERFLAALKWDPREPLLIHDLARTELRLDRVQPAIDRLTEYLHREPKDAAARALLATAYKQAGDRGRAEELLREALQLDPEDTFATLQLTDMLVQAGKIEQADKMLRETLDKQLRRPISRDSKHWIGELNTQLGDICLARKLLPEAVAHYQVALENCPEQFVANNNLAWLLATEPDPQIRNPDEALRLAQKAIELPGAKDKGALGTLAAALAAAGRMQDAVQAAEQALTVAREKGDPAAISQLQQQLQLHQAGQALVESVLSSP
ncbi:MAG: tetratricopeptide repeat protein [Pirellulaceae bacterium]|nr:tetratricopeptide repeat protein [Pirellulaceae bacterium]